MATIMATRRCCWPLRSTRTLLTFSTSRSHFSVFARKQKRLSKSTGIFIGYKKFSSGPLEIKSNPFTVLGIETSCDDTCMAIVSSDKKIHGHSISSQFEIHESYGGIVPSLAARAHEENIDHVLEDVLLQSQLTHETAKQTISAVAVTSGPGLQPCLGVGIKKAKEVCEAWNVPLIAIHHLEAHALVAMFHEDPSVLQGGKVEFPYLLLLVSGGHTQLVKCEQIGKYEILGTTLDDALGEAFDKTARLLDIPLNSSETGPRHGGELLEELAQQGDANAVQFTVPLQRRKDFNFSYSGLKSQVRRKVEMLGDLSQNDKANIAASFQKTATIHLRERILYALHQTQLSTLVVAGGVARNAFIRQEIQKLSNEIESLSVIYPPGNLCVDNGVMVAWSGIMKIHNNLVKEGGDIEYVYPTPRWKISETMESVVANLPKKEKEKQQK